MMVTQMQAATPGKVTKDIPAGLGPSMKPFLCGVSVGLPQTALICPQDGTLKDMFLFLRGRGEGSPCVFCPRGRLVPCSADVMSVCRISVAVPKVVFGQAVIFSSLLHLVFIRGCSVCASSSSVLWQLT